MSAITFEVELGERTLKIIQAFTEVLEKLQNRPESGIKDGEEEFLSSSDFCRKYKIGRSTLARRVEQGKVIKNDFGGRTPRYRWAKGYGAES